jgi:hypothetical protein
MDSVIRKRTPQPEFLREFLWKYQVRFDNMRKQIFLEFTKHGYINPAQAKPSSPATFHFKTFEHRKAQLKTTFMVAYRFLNISLPSIDEL